MVFSEEQLRSIREVVRELCERRVPPHFRDQICLIYVIEGNNVIIRESRASFYDLSKWEETDIAKLRYVRKLNEWKLYWKRASGKWWPYEPRTSSRTFVAMINEVSADEYGCFFG